MPPLLIFKFGGVSVQDASAIKNTTSIIKKFAVANRLLLVISAMGKMTNALEELHKQYFTKKNFTAEFEKVKAYHRSIVKELFSETVHPVYDELENLFVEMEWHLEEEPSNDYDLSYDQLVSFGELISTKIISQYLNKTAVNTKWVDARSFIQTDNTYRDARVNWALTEKLIVRDIPGFLEKQVVLTQGFIGGTSENFTTTLGREGSDFTAAIFAKCLKADSINIWKDVRGILNADPKLFPGTVKYEHLSYHQMIEMAYYGASVIHPKTIKPLVDAHIPLHVKCFKTPDEKGTIVDETPEEYITPAIILKKKQCLFSLSAKDYSFITEKNLSHIFDTAFRFKLKINLMQNSAISFSVCVDGQTGKHKDFYNFLHKDFHVLFNKDLELLTIMHYHDDLINKHTHGKEILLVQKTRHTFQAVTKVGV
ncbi:MAG: aspartate kinase [Bacteroidetes bacterium RIFCSPLOWO2_02_FULL_36_8]|nr:MAG: aspartate kinase [Bacteroidetes bacterium RIFCSPLOWO2_02_FULL_36_8]OFY68778.1 MAG: aspartate kinase [Bacteroidetes bacterium RIFCSPLOWO2_12_FULL_37_12]